MNEKNPSPNITVKDFFYQHKQKKPPHMRRLTFNIILRYLLLEDRVDLLQYHK